MGTSGSAGSGVVYDPVFINIDSLYFRDTGFIDTQFKARVVGKDPFDVEAIWEDLYNRIKDYGTTGMAISAISGIDIALWDILGRSLNVPVWQLLGGRKAERMPAYASGGWADAAGIGAQLNSYVARGGKLLWTPVAPADRERKPGTIGQPLPGVADRAG